MKCNKFKTFKNKQFGEIRVIEKRGLIILIISDIVESLGEFYEYIVSNRNYRIYTFRMKTNGKKQRVKAIYMDDILKLIDTNSFERNTSFNAEELKEWIENDILQEIMKSREERIKAELEKIDIKNLILISVVFLISIFIIVKVFEHKQKEIREEKRRIALELREQEKLENEIKELENIRYIADANIVDEAIDDLKSGRGPKYRLPFAGMNVKEVFRTSLGVPDKKTSPRETVHCSRLPQYSLVWQINNGLQRTYTASVFTNDEGEEIIHHFIESVRSGDGSYFRTRKRRIEYDRYTRDKDTNELKILYSERGYF